MISSLDRNAVLAGALRCLVIAAPAAVIQRLLADDGGTDQSVWVYVALAAILGAYLYGGAVAGRLAPHSPFAHGAAATVAAFAVVQTIGAVLRIIDGDGISPAALIFNVLLAASIGSLGAGWATRRGDAPID